MTYNLHLLFSSAQQFGMLTIFLQRGCEEKQKGEEGGGAEGGGGVGGVMGWVRMTDERREK